MSTGSGVDPVDVALSHPDPPAAPPPTASPSADVLAGAERLRVDTAWVVSGRVRVRRRIVTERRTIEVDVRREVVEVVGDDLDLRDGRLVGTAVTGPEVDPPTTPPPFVAVLREEVPRVVLDVRPYDRLTVTTTRVQDVVTVHDTLAHDEVDVVTIPARPAPPR